jgi:hypothetical protein
MLYVAIWYVSICHVVMRVKEELLRSSSFFNKIRYNTLQAIKKQFMMSPLHVSAPGCHLQGVYELKGSQVQHSTSGNNRPKCRL